MKGRSAAGELASPGWYEEVAGALRRWYRRSRRDLPWRRERDAYRVWVSEIMLQQTQVDRVIPYFERFVARFPDVRSLAAAREDEVLALWSGLGYYRRARQLWAAARVVRDRHDGVFPADLRDALALPGVGRYTAGAVLSVGYGLPVPLVDGNVERVVTRLRALEGDPRRAAVSRRVWREAEALVPETGAGELNQALMELGALVCTPTAPACVACVLSRQCAARGLGEPERFPERAARERRVDVRLGALLVERRGRILIARPPLSGDAAGPSYLRGVWNVPSVELVPEEDAARGLESRLARGWGGVVAVERLVGRARHSITFRRIALEVWRGRVVRAPGRRGRDPEGWDWRWALPGELGERFAVPSLAWKALRAGGFTAGGAIVSIPRKSAQGGRRSGR